LADPTVPVVSHRVHLVLAAVTGLLYYLAFPGVDFWPLSFIAWAPWMVGLIGRTPKQALAGGLIVGFATHFTGFSWLLGMLQTFSGFSLPICALFMVLLCAYQGGCWALLGWLYRRMVDRGWPTIVAFGLAFIAHETVYPFLFPFKYATTVHEAPAFVQLAEVGGPMLVSLTLISSSWALSLLAASFLRARATGAERSLSAVVRAAGPKWLVGLFLVPVLSGLYGLVRMRQIDAIVAGAEKIRVGIVQANMGLAEKRTQLDEGIRRHLELTRKVRVEDKAQLVVWSETSLTGVVHEDSANDYYQRNITRRLKIPAIIGAVLARKVDDARQYALFNSALITDKNGKVHGRYDKQVLLAFGEYLPFGESFPKLYDWSPNSGQFSPGKSFEPLPFGEHQIAVFICYEDIMPSFVNTMMSHRQPELLVNMTNDAWFGDTNEPWEHMALSKMRAVEQRRFFVRSTNSGISGFVDPVGRLLQRTPTFQQAAITQEVAWLKLRTPYQFLGEKPWWLASAAAFVCALVRRKKAKPPASASPCP